MLARPQDSQPKRLLIWSSAWWWGLQAAFLSPALALILVDLYGASTAELAWVLGIYNASGFVASLLLPAYADRKRDYLRPMLACAALTAALAGALWLSTSLGVATAALVVIGGPAGVGSSFLYAHLNHSGAAVSDVVNTRAIVSVAWVAGPPISTLIIGAFGNRSILLAIIAVAALNISTTALMVAQRRGAVASTADPHEQRPPAENDGLGVGRQTVALIMAAFILLQAANATSTSFLTVYVTGTLDLPVVWGGIALGLAAGLEVPALVLIGRCSGRFSNLGLLATSCLAGIGYYVGLALAAGPVELLALQPLSAWSYAGIAGIGLPLFHELVPRPGLSMGLFANTRRLGAIVSGAIIAVGAITVLADRAIFLACAVITSLGLVAVGIARIRGTRARSPMPTTTTLADE